jgi:DNA-binding response OmpR family regulator
MTKFKDIDKQLVLVVEDDEWLADQQALTVKAAGYETQIAHDAVAAIRLIDDIRPDVIILDVLLAGNTAFALMHELQAYGDTGDIPIILCTNLASELSIGNLRSYGVKIILDKSKMIPYDLVDAIKSVLI